MARLDEPLTINGMWLRNRLALAPITTNYGTLQGEVTAEVLGFYRQRARDVGLVIVEAAAVRADGRITTRSLGLWEAGHVQGMARLAKTIKDQGAAAVAQMVHSGARSAPVGGGIPGASPSGVRLRVDVEPTVLEEGQIAEIVSDFATAAGRAAEAGFHGVELLGAHFFLLSQFLSPLTNRRQDRYGGDVAGRATFALEVVRAIRDRVGSGYPILFRLNAVELAEGGLTQDEAVLFARLLEAAGVDALNSSFASQATWQEKNGVRYLQPSSAIPKEWPFGAEMPYASRIKAGVGIPVIGAGKLGEAATAARVVAEGQVDVVSIGRQMIADPATAGKILSGRGDTIVRCRECLSCLASIGREEPMICAVNSSPSGVSE